MSSELTQRQREILDYLKDAQRRTGHTLFGLQTWLALPEADEEGDPGFIHHDAGELPAVEDGPLSLRLVAGGMNGLRSPLKTASETLFADIVLKAGGRFGVEADTVERALYVLSGEVRVGGVAHGDQRLLILRPGDPVTLAAETDARVILLGGAPMEGPRYIWWNFVSSRPERIEQAKEEWAKGRFDTVPGDEEEFIPLPENIGKPRRATGGREFG